MIGYLFGAFSLRSVNTRTFRVISNGPEPTCCHLQQVSRKPRHSNLAGPIWVATWTKFIFKLNRKKVHGVKISAVEL
ncbi:hypothetical protein O181_022377 [Austropuccinia psidii MF-1]|uniref:Uncharacterized protein n=1 Tax=Austropuccinia psidii MF-1 TaxID=1389203 RepID=A0A9Q3CFC4_9BASI|nr:hypothetical protein [Austropuccinia psidii MF-1]